MGTIFLARPGTYVQYHLAGLQVRFDLIDLTLGQKRIDNNDRGHLWSLFTSVKKCSKNIFQVGVGNRFESSRVQSERSRVKVDGPRGLNWMVQRYET